MHTIFLISIYFPPLNFSPLILNWIQLGPRTDLDPNPNNNARGSEDRICIIFWIIFYSLASASNIASANLQILLRQKVNCPCLPTAWGSAWREFWSTGCWDWTGPCLSYKVASSLRYKSSLFRYIRLPR